MYRSVRHCNPEHCPASAISRFQESDDAVGVCASLGEFEGSGVKCL